VTEATNALIPETVIKGTFSELDECESALLTEKGLYMSRCKAIREDMKDVKDRAKDQGLPRAVVNEVMKERKLQKKLEAIGERLEENNAALLDYVRGKLGMLAETPLGEAAMTATKGAIAVRQGRKKKTNGADGDTLNSIIADDDKDMRPRFRQDGDAGVAA
jgi:uncharacterized protein (UPF0335 family)